VTFETFKLVYIHVSIGCTTVAFRRARNNRQDFLALVFMSSLMLFMFSATYVGSSKERHGGDLSEFFFRAFTHVQRDVVLTVCTVLLWGTVPSSML
jgi:hypothetical protein